MLSDILYVICSVGGLTMIVGGIYLLAKRKIYIDRTTEQPTEIVGLGVRFKTNVPGLVFFALGFIPLIYPVYKLDPSKYHVVETVRIRGSFCPTPKTMSVVYAAAAQDPVSDPGKTFSMKAPFLPDENQDYKVLLIANDIVIREKTVSWKDNTKGEIVVDFPAVPCPQTPPFSGSVRDVPPEYR